MGRKIRKSGSGSRESQPQTPQNITAPPSNQKLLIAAILLAAVTFAVYAPVLRYGFVGMDDPYFTTGRIANGLTLENIKWAFSNIYIGFYYPLTLISHMADRQLFRDWAGGYHLMNLLFHLANALLLLACLRRATKMPWRSFFVAALFALHPLHVESVAWVAERKDVLSTFFELLALFAYIRYTERRSIERYLAVFLAFACALLSKSMVVTFPFLLLLLDYWPLGRLDFSRVPGQKAGGFFKALKPLLLEKVPLFALLPVSAWLTLLAQIKEKALSSADRLPMDQRLANALLSYGRYILKMFVPTGLVAYVPHLQKNYPVPLVILAALFLAACTGAALYWGRRFRYLPVGWFWYLGTLLPAIGLIQTGLQASADRFTYVPLVGLLIILTWGIGDLQRIAPAGQPRWRWGAAVVLLLALSALSFNQVGMWRSNEILFRRILAYYPWCPFALINLGMELAQQKRYKEALPLFEQASRLTRSISPDMTFAWGLTLSRLERYEEAVARFQSALAQEPEAGDAHLELGFALSQLQRPAEAVSHYRKAYGKPDVRSEAIVWIGDIYRKGDLCDEAIQVYRIIPPSDSAYPSAIAGISACGGTP